MAGNVVTQEMVEELILSGADIIKVLICIALTLSTDRDKTGFQITRKLLRKSVFY